MNILPITAYENPKTRQSYNILPDVAKLKHLPILLYQTGLHNDIIIIILLLIALYIWPPDSSVVCQLTVINSVKKATNHYQNIFVGKSISRSSFSQRSLSSL